MEGYEFNDLCMMSDRALKQVMLAGTQPSVQDLVGYEFDGFNTLDVTPVLGIRRFRKGFFTTPDTPPGELRGYNVAVAPGGPVEPWVALMKDGEVHRHSYFQVYPVREQEKDNLLPNAVLINYDVPVNPFWNPGILRDYLVKVSPDNPDLFLGKAYVALGPGRLFVSYFVLRRGPASVVLW